MHSTTPGRLYLATVSLLAFVVIDANAQATKQTVATVTVRSELAAGRELIRTGKAVDAIPRIETVLQNDPDNYEAIHQLGIAFASTGNYSKAIPTLEKALQAKKNQRIDDPTIYNNLGWAYVLDGKPKMAELKFTEGLTRSNDISPETRTRLLNNLGYVYLTTGEWEKSERTLRTAATELDSSLARENLAVLERLKAAAARESTPPPNQK